jgi:predicted acetyltransferase
LTIEIRPVPPEDWETFGNAGATAFGSPIADHMDEERHLMEFDRTLAAFDGEEIVSTAAAISFHLTTPGAIVPAAGVTWVAVKPTHRRQGVLTRMMRRQLEDVRDRGEPLAILWASESVIYGRFGYGVSTLGAEFEIERPWAKIAHGHDGQGKMRLVSRDEALAAWPAVYAAVAAGQPGMFARSEDWWEHKILMYEEVKPEQKSYKFRVQYEEDGEPLGYALYTVKANWTRNNPDGTLEVEELMTLSDHAYTALWNYLFGVDLISTVKIWRRRPQEPLIWLLDEPRRLYSNTHDALWLRIVDVEGALQARRYADEGRITIEVRDGFCSWTAGHYELEGGPEGAACKKTTRAPDLTMSAADLGAAYLGGVKFRTLQRAGRVHGDDEAIRRADRMFTWEVEPWCPEIF